MVNFDQFTQLASKAVIWTQQQEQKILKDGIPLSKSQLEDARNIPVKYPEKVRLLQVDKILQPEDAELKLANQDIKLITSETIGLTC